MKFPPKEWLKRLARRVGGRSKEHHGEGIEHLHSGQVLRPGKDRSVSLVLKGHCETRRQVVEPLDAGDAADQTIRAVGDSTVLRLSREAVRRLTQRWPAMGLWPERRPSVMAVPSAGLKRNGGGVVCLMPLSEGIPCADFALGIAETIAKETGQPVLRVVVGAKDGVPSRNGAPAPLTGSTDIFVQHADGGDGKAARALAQMMDRGRDQFHHVIVELARNGAMGAFREILERSAAVYPVLRQNGESLFELNLLVREAGEQGFGAVSIKPLVYLDAAEHAHGLSCYIEETVKKPVHLYLRGAAGDDSRLKANLRRLGREMCGHQVGLVLSSGAARGLSHIGVIQVLEENGIEVDLVAGSSIGAYIAAVWGAGYGGKEMEQFARELEGYRGLWSLMDAAIYPRRGFLLTTRVRKRLERTLGLSHFSDLARPIRVVATRLDTLERVVFSGGNVVDAVLASVSIPGVCVPVTLDGTPYVDGGICDPLPVDVLTGMGVRKIIAVNTIATPETLRACRLEAAEVRARHTLRGRLNAYVNPFAAGNAFDTLMRSIHAAQTRLAEASCREASVVLRPYSCDGRWHDFGNPSRYIPLGRQAAEAQMPAIQALIKSPTDENHPTSQQVLAHAA